jgi:signal transduction histidine kinase
MRSLDIKECIVEALNFMKQEIQDRSVKVKCSWPDILPKISGDVDQLKQAFYNILKNALQAMPEGGEINISCSFDDEELEITFADNGSGIEAENISSIFEPYYTTKSNGSGLGLMIIERIFREHGAELAIESSPGKGTEFIIRFPRGNRRMRVLPAPDEDIEIEAIS